MAHRGPEPIDQNPQSIKSVDSQTDLNERVGNTIVELYQLLEGYAPAWYTEELHERAEAALRALGRINQRSNGPRTTTRNCRNSRTRPGQSAR